MACCCRRRVLDVAAARLRQLARVAAAALARRGADPARDARRRRDDRHQRHADGAGPRHRTGAPRALDADRRAGNGRRAPRPARGCSPRTRCSRRCRRSCAERASVAVPQHGALATVARKIAKAEALLDWREPRRRSSSGGCARSIRGPSPRRDSTTAGDYACSRPSSRADGSAAAPPGTVVAAGRDGIDVATGEGVLRLKRIQPPSGRAMDAAAYLAAHSLCRSGVCLLSPRRPAPRSALSRRELVARVLEQRVAADDLLARGRRCGSRPAAARGVACSVRCAGITASNGKRRGCSRGRWSATRLTLAALLRVGLLQLQELRIPEHAAVSATVDATAMLGMSSAPRARQRSAAALPARARAARARGARGGGGALRSPAVARRGNPRGPSARLAAAARRQQRGAADVAARQSAAHDPRGLSRQARARPGCPPQPPLRRTPASAVRLEEPTAVEALPGFAPGEVSVQDLSAQHAAPLLELGSRQRVLDACAAPGGKTGHILETMRRTRRCLGRRSRCRTARARARQPRPPRPRGDARSRRRDDAGRLVGRRAVRPDPHRRAVQRDGRHSPPSRHQGAAQTGGRRARGGAAAAAAPGALAAAAPGGRLVYATCSVLKRENDEQIAAFRATEPTIEADGGVATLQLLPEEARRRWLLLCLVTKAARVANAQWIARRNHSPIESALSACALVGPGLGLCRRRHARSEALAQPLVQPPPPVVVDERDDPGFFEIRSAMVELLDGVYFLNAVIAYRLSTEARDALHSGVPLGIRLDVEIIHPRRWWFDNENAALRQSYQLEYHALSERYIVLNVNSGDQESFASLFAALELSRACRTLSDHRRRVDRRRARLLRALAGRARRRAVPGAIAVAGVLASRLVDCERMVSMAVAKRIRSAFLTLLAVVGILLWLVALLSFTRVTENTDEFAQHGSTGSC